MELARPRINKRPKWEPLKNEIFDLYMVQKKDLSEVMRMMEEQHQFMATVSQYRYQLEKWGFWKHMTTKRIGDPKAIGVRLSTIRKKADEADGHSHLIYCGIIIKDRTLRRRGILTPLIEQHPEILDKGRAKTPSGIRFGRATALGRVTESSLPFYNLKFILYKKLEGRAPPAPNPDEQSGPHQEHCIWLQISTISFTLPRSLLGTCGSFELDYHGNIGLIVYHLSNNLMATLENQFSSWMWGRVRMLYGTDSDFWGEPSAKAMLETSLILAVEAEDVSVVQTLLRLRNGTNMHKIHCTYDGVPGYLSALEYACICGNLEIARLLIDSGHPVREASHGWRRSLLVMAILGWNERNVRENRESLLRVRDMESQSGVCHTSHDTIELLLFLQLLINAGARVQLPPESWDASAFDVYTMSRSVKNPLVNGLSEGHTPLTAASLHHNTAVVDDLLARGAEVLDFNQGHGSALASCIRNFWNYQESSGSFFNRPGVWNYRMTLCESAVFDIATRYLQAGANPNEFVPTVKLTSIGLVTAEFDKINLLHLVSPSQPLVELLLRYEARLMEYTDFFWHEIIKNRRQDYLHLAIARNPDLPDEVIRSIFGLFELGDRSWFESIMDDRNNRNTELEFFTKTLKLSKTNGILNLPFPEFLEYLEFYTKDSVVNFLNVVCPNLTVETLHRLARDSELLKELVRSLNPELITHAILQSNFQMANYLIGAGLDINAVTKNGETPLTASIQMENRQLIGRIWRMGARTVNPGSILCDCGQPLVANALVTAAEVGNLNCINSLISNSLFDINRHGVLSDRHQSRAHLPGLPCKCGSALTAAILEGQTDIVEVLLAKGASPNRWLNASPQTLSPLAASILVNDISIAQKLLLIGAIPLDHLAIRNISFESGPDFIELFLYFLQGRDDSKLLSASLLLNKALRSFPSSSDHSSHAHYYKVMDRILRTGNVMINDSSVNDSFPPSPLYTALIHGHSEMILALVRAGAMVNILLKGPPGSPSISPLRLCLTHRCGLTKLKLLLQLGAHDMVNPRDPKMAHASPIELAVRDLDFEATKLLLGKHFDPNPWPKSDRTALQLALFPNNRNSQSMELAKLLLREGASPDLFGQKDRLTPLQQAIRHGNLEVVQLLLEHHANVNQHSELSLDAEPSARYQPDDILLTPLQLAIKGRNLMIIETLLRHKADIDLRANRADFLPSGYKAASTDPFLTPLQLAVSSSYPECVEMLLLYKADVNAPAYPHRGATVLQYAAMKGYVGLAEILLEKGARVNAAAAENHGRTALEGAAEYGRLDMVQLLLNAGARVDGPDLKRALERAEVNGHIALKEYLEEKCAGVLSE
ncbi:ankyrin repeat-containing domain protein [Triangularia setosa]|uniref:Ankyrin repeat-containing domain protein n=1 Tax=Triangularia setosa TaxID=2587417 RepID=A0AAN7A4Q1_9PEZI|nr:ankyrin repeat-containing domain protein [Podospora setosa]